MSRDMNSQNEPGTRQELCGGRLPGNRTDQALQAAHCQAALAVARAAAGAAATAVADAAAGTAAGAVNA